jgi:flagellum-specific peptidoglycan hydrolase FlgJ
MMILKLTFLTLGLLWDTQDIADKTAVLSYIEEHKFLAIDEMVRSGIPASITLAQAIIESNAGQSKLSKISNNHFGIKCKDYWEGNTYYHPDDDRDASGKLIPSCFRKYETINESYEDHSSFLMNTPAYQPLFGYDKTDYRLWAEGLEICGYASDEQYAEKLIRTIEAYQLHELDYYTIQYVKRENLSLFDASVQGNKS